MRSITISVGYGWASEQPVNLDKRWQELRDFCKSVASQGRNQAAASLKNAVSDDADETTRTGKLIPNVTVSRLRSTAGRFIWESITKKIQESDILVFDITPTKIKDDGSARVAENVWLEIGYALALKPDSVYLVHVDSKGYKSLPSDLSGLTVGTVTRALAKEEDRSLRASLAGAVRKKCLEIIASGSDFNH